MANEGKANGQVGDEYPIDKNAWPLTLDEFFRTVAEKANTRPMFSNACPYELEGFLSAVTETLGARAMLNAVHMGVPPFRSEFVREFAAEISREREILEDPLELSKFESELREMLDDPLLLSEFESELKAEPKPWDGSRFFVVYNVEGTGIEGVFAGDTLYVNQEFVERCYKKGDVGRTHLMKSFDRLAPRE